MEKVHDYCKKRRASRQVQAHGDQVQGVIPQSHPSIIFPGLPPAPNILKAPELIPRLDPSSSKLSPDAQEDPILPSDTPLEIHGYLVEEYQRIYHSVVDDMIKYKSAKSRPYNLQLGRKIKQRLWETLGRPKVAMVEKSEGIMQVEESMGTEVYPPLIDVDISREPHP